MYAIAQVIYGIPLTSNDENFEFPNAERIEDAVENDVDGFLSYYSGGGDNCRPIAFGVHLCRFNEACAYVPINSLKLVPSEDQKKEFTALVDALPRDLQDTIKLLGEPTVFILWSTS